MKQVYDPIRQKWVAATPEEIVRQTWIRRMVQELHFPKELLVVERELKMLPHLQNHPHPLPTRRVDVLSFGKGIDSDHPVFPLLLIECKNEPLSQEALDQAVAYNTFVQAFYVAIVNQDQIRLRYNLYHKRSQIEGLGFSGSSRGSTIANGSILANMDPLAIDQTSGLWQSLNPQFMTAHGIACSRCEIDKLPSFSDLAEAVRG
jgi:hypothetical protein